MAVAVSRIARLARNLRAHVVDRHSRCLELGTGKRRIAGILLTQRVIPGLFHRRTCWATYPSRVLRRAHATARVSTTSLQYDYQILKSETETMVNMTVRRSRACNILAAENSLRCAADHTSPKSALSRVANAPCAAQLLGPCKVNSRDAAWASAPGLLPQHWAVGRSSRN